MIRKTVRDEEVQAARCAGPGKARLFQDGVRSPPAAGSMDFCKTIRCGESDRIVLGFDPLKAYPKSAQPADPQLEMLHAMIQEKFLQSKMRSYRLQRNPLEESDEQASDHSLLSLRDCGTYDLQSQNLQRDKLVPSKPLERSALTDRSVLHFESSIGRFDSLASRDRGSRPEESPTKEVRAKHFQDIIHRLTYKQDRSKIAAKFIRKDPASLKSLIAFTKNEPTSQLPQSTSRLSHLKPQLAAYLSLKKPQDPQAPGPLKMRLVVQSSRQPEASSSYSLRGHLDSSLKKALCNSQLQAKDGRLVASSGSHSFRKTARRVPSPSKPLDEYRLQRKKEVSLKFKASLNSKPASQLLISEAKVRAALRMHESHKKGLSPAAFVEAAGRSRPSPAGRASPLSFATKKPVSRETQGYSTRPLTERPNTKKRSTSAKKRML